jgi:ureidoglycolate lyase
VEAKPMTGNGKEIWIDAEPVTRESFAPYGTLLGVVGEPTPHVYGDTLYPYRAGRLESDAEVEWIYTTYSVREFRVQYLERHHNITQTFIPLGGDPIVAAVAPPDAELRNGLPLLETVRAFVVPGTAAVNLHRGTWHEVPFPVVDGQVTLLTSHAGVTTGWASLDDQGGIDKREQGEEKRDVLVLGGVRLMIKLPADLAQPAGTPR